MRGQRFVWQGKVQHVRLDPAEMPFAIWRIAPQGGRAMNAPMAAPPVAGRAGSALVQGRDHLSGARQVVLRCQQRRHRRFSRPDREARLHRRARRQHASGCCRSIRRRGATTATTSPTTATCIPTTARSPTSSASSRRRTRAASASSPNWSSTTRPTSIRGSSARASAKPGSTARNFYVWSDTDKKYAGHAHHLHRHRAVELDVGSGRRGLLLAPLLFAPARSEFRQSRGAEAKCCR